jgi:site-specific DNA-cytosine methylase
MNAGAEIKGGRCLIAFPAHLSGTQCAAEVNLAPSLQAVNPTAVAGYGKENAGVRRLTPLECERLQGFPDDWTAGFADTARYRMLGNAVAVVCSEWIGRRLVGVEATR